MMVEAPSSSRSQRGIAAWFILSSSVLIGLSAGSWSTLVRVALVLGYLINLYLLTETTVVLKAYSKLWAVPLFALFAGALDALKIILIGGVIFFLLGLLK